jgi:DNA repair protein SbcD/Mre11
MRLLHTSDWHLGHTLHDWDRQPEHDAFLRWLIEVMEREQVDALLVTGDIFETGNPPADAQRAFYEFLAQARRAMPLMGIVIIGGNHDSAARLDAPDPILRALDVRVVGGLPRNASGIDLDRLLIPLKDRYSRPGALIAAVPYLRNADLPVVDGADPLIEGVRRIYDQVLGEARRRRQPGEALVATGHLFMQDGLTSDLSERKILGGNQHALPVETFGADVDYVALGHLHLPQSVGGLEHVRYAGSPLPLSMGESTYRHQVVVVDFVEGRFEAARPILIPRTVEMVRVPSDYPAIPELVLPQLSILPYDDLSVPVDRRPFLDVRVRVERFDPTLRRVIEQAVAGKAVRLVGLHIDTTGKPNEVNESGTTLQDLVPEEVFRLRWARDHHSEPPAEMLECFHELLQAMSEAKEAA